MLSERARMGIDLVKSMLIHHARNLTGNECAVLTYMCATALDRPNDKGQPAGMYFAGREPLALILGYPELTKAAMQAVSRATVSLVAKGIIAPTVKARAGSRQSFRLEVGMTRTTESEVLSTTEDVVLWTTESEVLSTTEGEVPRTHSRNDQDLPQDISPSTVTELQNAREQIRANRNRRK